MTSSSRDSAMSRQLGEARLGACWVSRHQWLTFLSHYILVSWWVYMWKYNHIRAAKNLRGVHKHFSLSLSFEWKRGGELLNNSGIPDYAIYKKKTLSPFFWHKNSTLIIFSFYSTNVFGWMLLFLLVRLLYYFYNVHQNLLQVFGPEVDNLRFSKVCPQKRTISKGVFF